MKIYFVTFVSLMMSISAWAQIDKESCASIKSVISYYSTGLACKDVYDKLTTSNSLESRAINWTNDAVTYCESGNLTKMQIDNYRARLQDKLNGLDASEAYELQKSYRTLLAGSITIGIKPYSGEMRDPFVSPLNCRNDHSFIRAVGKFKTAQECSECQTNENCAKLKPYRSFFADLRTIDPDAAAEVKKSIEVSFPKSCVKIYYSPDYQANHGTSVGELYEECVKRSSKDTTALDAAYESSLAANKKTKIRLFNKIYESEKNCKSVAFENSNAADRSKSVETKQ